MLKTTLKNINETRVQTDDNSFQNIVSLSFETENNGQIQLETITLKGNGTIKSTIMV